MAKKKGSFITKPESLSSIMSVYLTDSTSNVDKDIIYQSISNTIVLTKEMCTLGAGVFTLYHITQILSVHRTII